MGKSLLARFSESRHYNMHMQPCDAVLKSFMKQFPEACDTEWFYKHKRFKVVFSHASKHFTAYFDKTGTWKETHCDIPENELPPIIRAVLIREFEKISIISTLRICKPEGCNYKLIIDTWQKSRYFVVIDDNGDIKRQELLFVVKPGLIK